MLGVEAQEKLKQETMWNLFLNMEMPLIYSLYHMEQAGIRVEKETLRAYGKTIFNTGGLCKR